MGVLFTSKSFKGVTALMIEMPVSPLSKSKTTDVHFGDNSSG